VLKCYQKLILWSWNASHEHWVSIMVRDASCSKSSLWHCPSFKNKGQKDENHVHTEFWDYVLVVFYIKCITFHVTDFTLFFLWNSLLFRSIYVTHEIMTNRTNQSKFLFYTYRTFFKTPYFKPTKCTN